MNTEEISTKIIEELSANPDKIYSISQIHYIFYEKYEDFRKLDTKRDMIQKLNISFLTIEGEYNNIYRIVVNGKHYLVWSLKDKETVIKENTRIDGSLSVQKYTVKEQYEKEFHGELEEMLSAKYSQKDFVDIIKKNITDKNYSFMYESNYMDGTNNPAHILILNGETNLFKKLLDVTNVDLYAKNREGKSCRELIMETKNCELLEILLEERFKNKIDSLNKINEELKANQKKSYEEISGLKENIKKLQEKIKDLETSNLIEWIKSIILFIVFIIYIKNFIN